MNRRDRDRTACPRCGKTVTVTRSGRLMAHRGGDGRTCVAAAHHARQHDDQHDDSPTVGGPGFDDQGYST